MCSACTHALHLPRCIQQVPSIPSPPLPSGHEICEVRRTRLARPLPLDVRPPGVAALAHPERVQDRGAMDALLDFLPEHLAQAGFSIPRALFFAGCRTCPYRMSPALRRPLAADGRVPRRRPQGLHRHVHVPLLLRDVRLPLPSFKFDI